jgi:hypothetical protein
MALTITRTILSGAIYKIVMTGFVESGTASSGTLTTLTDTSKSRTVNADIGRCIFIYTGTGTGAVGWVSSNTATAWTVEAFYLPDFQGGVTKITPDNTSQYGLLGTDADIYAASVAGGWGAVTLTGNTYYFSDCLYIGDGTNKTGIQFTNNAQFGIYGTPRAFASAANTAVVLGRRTKTKSTRNGVILLEYCTRADSSAGGYGANFGAQWDDLAGYVYVYGSTLKSKLHNVPVPNTQSAAFYLPYKFDFLQSNVDSDGFALFSTILGSFSRCNITNGQGLPLPLWLYSPNVTFDDVTIYASYQGLRIAYNYDGVLKNCNLIDNTYPVHLYGAVNDSSKFSGLLRLINTQADLTAILVDTYVTGSIQKEYEWGLNANNGTNPIAGVKVYATNASGTEVVNTITDAYGNIPTQSIIVQKRTGYAGSLVNHAPHTYGFRKYGYFSDGATKTLTSKTDDGVKLRVSPYVVASEATAAAMTGITVTSSATSLSSSHSLQDIYDRGQYLSQQSFITEPWTTSDGITFVQSTGRVFTPGSYIDWGTSRLVGGTVTFGTPGPFSPRIGTITVRFTAAGTYAMTDADFGGIVTFTNTSGGAVTVELPAGISYVNTGPSVTIVEPQTYQSVTLTGGITGSRVQLYDLTSSTEVYNAIPSSWPFTWTDSVPYIADRQIRLRVMSQPGTTATLLIDQVIGTATGTSPAISFLVGQVVDTVYNTNAIVGSTVTGVEIIDGTLRVQVSTGTITWQELYAYETYWLFTEEGIRDEGRFAFAPDPSNYKWYDFKLKNTISPSAPLVVSGGYGVDGDTGTSIAMIDTTGGTIIMAVDHVVNNIVTVGGSNIITGDIAEVTSKVQAGLTAQGYTVTKAGYLDATISSRATISGIETSAVLAKEATVATIPTSTLLSTDIRLNNLDTTISSRATVSGIESSTVLAKEATVASIPTSTLLSTDARLNNLDTTISSRATVSGIESSTVLAKEATVASIPTATLLSNDSRLNNLDATISSRATVSGIESSTVLAKETTVAAIPTTTLLSSDSRLNNLDANISSILATDIESGLTLGDMSKIILAAVVGKTAGVGSSTETYLAQDGTTQRIVVGFDSDNNRTSVTLDAQ